MGAVHGFALEEFKQYVETNLQGMIYQPNRIHGSGVIEKMAELIVKKRMKRQGMRWTKEGANNILALRAEFFNKHALRVNPIPQLI